MKSIDKHDVYMNTCTHSHTYMPTLVDVYSESKYTSILVGTPRGMGDTTIRVSEELADELYDRKHRGESYADVIRELLRSEQGENTDELEARVRALSSRVAALDEEMGSSPLERLEGLALLIGDVGDGIGDVGDGIANEEARGQIDEAIDALYRAADALD